MAMLTKNSLFLFVLIISVIVRVDGSDIENDAFCNDLLGNELIEEIASYAEARDIIYDYVFNGEFKGKTYDELATFVDKFGARPSGSEILEDSIDYIVELSKSENLDVATEEVQVPRWERLEEKATMLQPRLKNINILGLGRSVGTPPEGIIGEVIVVESFDDFEAMGENEVLDKIVLFAPQFTIYGETVAYRTNAAVTAAAKGAVATLVRSITPFSIDSPHTGAQTYRDEVKKIPAAAVTIEDADLIARLTKRGEKVIIHLNMSSTYDETHLSRNTIVELKGRESPEKLVIVSGHIDSWDVGQGAMDDGGGVFISWASPVILKRLGLIPKRSIQAIFWTSEEIGINGGIAYKEKHIDNFGNINFVMESDIGTFSPLGLNVAGNNKTICIVRQVLKLFEGINASTVIESSSLGSDIEQMVVEGVPGASLYNANDRYFWYHHTEGDTMNVENSDELDLCTAFWTAVSYIIANLSIEMPR